MSKNTKLFEEAIADAKTLRDTAVANAKAALEESFAPRISAMFEKRMQDLEEAEDVDEVYVSDKDDLLSEDDDMTAEMYNSDDNMDLSEKDVDLEELFNSLSEEDLEETMGTEKEAYAEGEDEMEENYDLEEILRELEEEENAIYEDEDGEMDLNENEDLEEKASKDEDISEVTVDELRDMIQDAIRDVMGGEGADAAGEDEMNLDMDMDMDMDMEEPAKDDDKKEKEGEEDEDMKEIADLERTLAERRKAKVEKEKAMMERRKYKGSEEDKKDLQEAIRTIKTLRGQLNEVNLLNAKLIYVNKLFKAHNLTEGQKVNIVNSFDKAATLNEAKNVFDILKSTISKSAPKTSLKESKSFASSVIGGRPAAKPIINEDETISRMQRLAGIK
jgi:hypothetical protein